MTDETRDKVLALLTCAGCLAITILIGVAFILHVMVVG